MGSTGVLVYTQINEVFRSSTPCDCKRDDFRKSYKEANPDSKNGSMVSKEGGEKWKSMTDEEKKPYLEKAAELKAEYERALEKFNAGNEGNEENEEEGGSDKEE